MTTLYTGLRGSEYLDESQKSDVLKYIRQWETSPQRKFQIESQQYYRGAQEISKKLRTYRDSNDQNQPYPSAVPNTHVVYNLYRKIVDQKVMFISERKLKFISLPSHPVEYNNPDSVNHDSAGDVSPTETYEPVKTGDFYQIKVKSNKENDVNKEYLSVLDKLFNDEWYLKLHRALTYCLVDGECWLYPYIDEGDFNVRVFRGSEVCPIYTDETNEKLAAVARWFEVSAPDEAHTKETYIEIYRRDNVLRYKVQNNNTNPTLVNGTILNYIRFDNAAEAPSDTPEAYRWNSIPFIHIVSQNPPEPLLARCKEIQDAQNRVLSNWVDNALTYPDGAVLIVQNAMGTDISELWENICKHRALKVTSTPEMPGGDVKFLENPVKGDEYVLLSDKLRAAQYDVCAGFDDTNPNILSSHLQELTLKMTMMSMEQDANLLIASYESAIMRLIKEFYCPYLVTKGFPDYSDVPIGVRVGDVRIRNVAELTNLMVSMGLRMSPDTMLEQHPWTKDNTEEKERMVEARNFEVLCTQILAKQQADLQEQAAEKQQERMMQQQKTMGANPAGGEPNTGSPKGGGKAADLNTALQKKEKTNKDPMAQPQR